jgi:hypothetical protein
MFLTKHPHPVEVARSIRQFLAECDLKKLLQDRLVKALADSIRLRAARFRFCVLNAFERQVKFEDGLFDLQRYAFSFFPEASRVPLATAKSQMKIADRVRACAAPQVHVANLRSLERKPHINSFLCTSPLCL